MYNVIEVITMLLREDYLSKIRGFYDAILTSSSTVTADNPEMHHKNKIYSGAFIFIPFYFCLLLNDNL